MNYTPQEGIDYITDLYAVVGVEPTAESEEIKKAINSSIREYHPDRLEGLAPEFQQRGEQMARILNKARGILLDSDKRATYDDILQSWDGPVSTTGTPTITIIRHLQAELAQKSPDEIVAEMAAGDEKVETLSKSNEGLVSMLEKMVETAGEDVPEELLTQYEAALLEHDRNLAIKEAQRVDILGLPQLESRQFRANLEYGEDTALAIEARKEAQLEETRTLALGEAATKLALLAGENPAPTTELANISEIKLPAYFEVIAGQVAEIATKRQTIVERRLGIFKPHYPESEAQQTAKPEVLIGIGKESPSWFCGRYDSENQNVDFADIPNEIRQLLDEKDYRAVIEAGYNVMTFDPLEQVDLQDQLGEALDKYVTKYFPDSLES